MNSISSGYPIKQAFRELPVAKKALICTASFFAGLFLIIPGIYLFKHLTKRFYKDLKSEQAKTADKIKQATASIHKNVDTAYKKGIEINKNASLFKKQNLEEHNLKKEKTTKQKLKKLDKKGEDHQFEIEIGKPIIKRIKLSKKKAKIEARNKAKLEKKAERQDNQNKRAGKKEIEENIEQVHNKRIELNNANPVFFGPLNRKESLIQDIQNIGLRGEKRVLESEKMRKETIENKNQRKKSLEKQKKDLEKQKKELEKQKKNSEKQMKKQERDRKENLRILQEQIKIDQAKLNENSNFYRNVW